MKSNKFFVPNETKEEEEEEQENEKEAHQDICTTYAYTIHGELKYQIYVGH